MHEPSAGEGVPAGSNRRPPAVNRSRSPKLHISSTPRVWSPILREAVPMPPANSKQVMPVPPPTEPSATSAVSDARARITSSTVMVRESARSESSHSPTTGIRVLSGSPPSASTAAW